MSTAPKTPKWVKAKVKAKKVARKEKAEVADKAFDWTLKAQGMRAPELRTRVIMLRKMVLHQELTVDERAELAALEQENLRRQGGLTTT